MQSKFLNFATTTWKKLIRNQILDRDLVDAREHACPRYDSPLVRISDTDQGGRIRSEICTWVRLALCQPTPRFAWGGRWVGRWSHPWTPRTGSTVAQLASLVAWWSGKRRGGERPRVRAWGRRWRRLLLLLLDRGEEEVVGSMGAGEGPGWSENSPEQDNQRRKRDGQGGIKSSIDSSIRVFWVRISKPNRWIVIAHFITSQIILMWFASPIILRVTPLLLHYRNGARRRRSKTLGLATIWVVGVAYAEGSPRHSSSAKIQLGRVMCSINVDPALGVAHIRRRPGWAFNV
jgi:hypothetical protein